MPMTKKRKLEKKMKTEVPENILVQLLHKLPVKTVIRFSCVSKRWCSITSNPEFAKSHFKVASKEKTLTPRLIEFTAPQLKSINLNLKWSSGSKYSDKELTCPFKKFDSSVLVLGSCNGLVCVALDTHEDYYFWNPTTGFSLRLPDPSFSSKSITTLYNYGFGYVSATDDYKVLVATRLDDPTEGDPVEVFSLIANSWGRIEAPKLPDGSKGVFSNEAPHWPYMPEPFTQAILGFDLAKEEFREVELPILTEDNFIFGQVGVLLEGFLCVTIHNKYYPHNMEVWVMKEYSVRESWAKLFKFMISVKGHSYIVHSNPMFFRESGTVVLLTGDDMLTQLRRYDKEEDNFCNCKNRKAHVCNPNLKEDKLEKDLVCGRRYMLEDNSSVDNMVEYVESLLPFLSNMNVAYEQTQSVGIPTRHLITVQQLSVQNITGMFPAKLTRTNFTQWKWLFLLALNKYGVQGHVDGTEICSPAFQLDAKGKVIDRVNPAFDKWIDRDQSVLIWLNSRISEDLLPYTIGASSSRALWMTLEKAFANASRVFSL